MINKFKKKKACPEKSPAIDKAAKVAEQYKQLSLYCEVLSGIKGKSGASTYSSGYRVWAHQITGAGIDIEEVYLYIGKLAQKRKLELELELGKLE